MGEGYVVNELGIAARVGELNAVADEVANVVGVLGATGCNLGPGEISSAVAEVMQQWSDNLGDMRDKIGDAAKNVNNALTNYQVLEDAAENRMREVANQEVVNDQMNVLRGAAAVTLAQEQAGNK